LIKISSIIRKLVRTAFLVPLNVVYLFASFIPKRKNLWLFSSWKGQKFLDNPKYIFNYILENENSIHPYWMLKDKRLFEDMQREGYPVVFAYSLRGIVYLLRAGAVIFTHSVEWEFIACCVGYTTKRVQTWHGIPLKKIGYDDHIYSSTRLKVKIRMLLLLYTTDKLDLVLAASEDEKKHLVTAFGVKDHVVVVTGYPRNDKLTTVISSKTETKPNLKKIIYMPTFRGSIGSEFKLLSGMEFDFPKINQILHASNAELHIKLHPVQKFSTLDIELISQHDRIHTVFDVGDVYLSLGSYDLLITDFSGVFFDYLITGKPIILAPLDMKNYIIQDRELYYDYNDICPDPPCYTWSEVFERISEVLNPGYERSPRYIELQDRFHRYLDDESSFRAVKEIRKIINK